MYTQSDIDNIEKAIASGARVLRMSDGREIEYQSIADMLRAKSDMQAEILKNSKFVRVYRPIVRNGW